MDDTRWIIRGPFVVLIRASRWVGIAPVRLVPLLNGYSASVSRRYVVYSKIFMTLLSTIGIISSIIDVNYGQLQKEEMLKVIFMISNILLNSAIVVYATYNSVERMTRLGEYINILEKVEKKENVGFNKNIKQSRKTTFLFHLMTYSFLFVHTVVVNVVRMHSNNLAETLFLFVYLTVGLTQMLLEIQIIYLALRILWSMMESINEKLNSILDGNISGFDKSKLFKNIRVLTRSYVDVCEMVLRTTEADGVILFLIFCETIQSLLLFGYIFCLDLLKLSSLGWYQLLIFSACVAITLKLLIFIDAFHGFIKEANSTRLTISELMYQTTPVGEKISVELEMMYKQLTMNSPQYSPLGMFTLQRSIIITVISLVTSCAVYLAQIDASK